MKRKSFWVSLIAVIVSFAGGFLLANALNRREIESLTVEVGRLKNSAPAEEKNDSQSTLTDDEIRQKIAEADKNPEDTESQKNLAMALYRYAGMTGQSKWLPEVARLLKSAVEKNPKDYNSLIYLGDIYFDLAQSEKNPEEAGKNLDRAREFYKRVLAINPNDSQLQTSFGATYLFANPPDNEKAIAEFQKSLQINPKNEKTLEYIAKTFLNEGKPDEAKKYFDKLKEVNPGNPALTDLETRLSQPAKK